MLTMQDGAIVALRAGRTIRLTQVTEDDRYRALLMFQVRPSVAAALLRGLITVSVKTH